MEAQKVIGNLIWVDSDRVSGSPCFYGTRVPIEILFDYIEGGDTIEEFLVSYPGVSRVQVLGVIALSRKGVEQIIEAA